MRAFWERLSHAPWFRRSVRTFLQAFLALLVPGLLGFLHDLTEWSRSQGQAPFPDVHSFAYVGVTAILAGVIAVVTALWTKVEDGLGHGLLRTVNPPPPPPPPTGAVSWPMLLVIALLVVVLAVLLL